MNTDIQVFTSPQFGEVRTAKSAELGSWLDGRSEFFTLISGFTVTRRVALAVNAVAMLVAVAAITAEGNLFLSAAAAIGAVAVVRAGKKGGWL